MENKFTTPIYGSANIKFICIKLYVNSNAQIQISFKLRVQF